jgi:hypothetical protein
MRFSRSECEQCMLAINSEKKIQEIQKRSLALDFTEAYLQEGVFFYFFCRRGTSGLRLPCAGLPS